MPCPDCRTPPSCFRLTVPQSLLNIAAAQNDRHKETALVAGTLSKRNQPDTNISIYIGNDDTMQLTFQAFGAEPIFTIEQDLWECKVSSVVEKYTVVAGIYHDTVEIPYGQSVHEPELQYIPSKQENYADNTQVVDFVVESDHSYPNKPSVVKENEPYGTQELSTIECDGLHALPQTIPEYVLCDRPSGSHDINEQHAGHEKLNAENHKLCVKNEIGSTPIIESTDKIISYNTLESPINENQCDDEDDNEQDQVDAPNVELSSKPVATTLPKHHRLLYNDGKPLNFLTTADGKNIYCELCEPARSFRKLENIKQHVGLFHGILWSDYAKYIAAKGETEADSLKKELLRKSNERHTSKRRSAKGTRRNYLNDEKEESESKDEMKDLIKHDKAMENNKILSCTLCKRYTNKTPELVLTHVLKHHKRHKRQVEVTDNLMKHMTTAKSTLPNKDSRDMSLVTPGGTLFKCVICLKCDVRKWSSLRTHVIKCHHISWFEYQDILHQTNSNEKTQRIKDILNLSQVEKQKCNQISASEPETSFTVYKYNGIDIVTPGKKSKELPVFCPQCYKPHIIKNYNVKLFDHIRNVHRKLSNMTDLLLKADDQVYEKTLLSNDRLQSDLLIGCTFCTRQRRGAAIMSHLRRCHRQEPGFTERYNDLKNQYSCLPRKTKNNRITMKSGCYSECSHCKRVFSSKSIRNKHVFYHCTGHPDRLQYKCNVCYVFRGRTQQNLDDHMVRTHSTKKTYPCGQCDKVFQTNGGRFSHMQIQHATEEDVSSKFHHCEHPGCTKKYRYLNDMRRHTLTHLNIRPFECAYCGKFFKTARCERNHTQRLHLSVGANNYKYPCTRCDSGFNTKKLLMSHECNNTEQCITRTGKGRNKRMLDSVDAYNTHAPKRVNNQKNNMTSNIEDVHKNAEEYGIDFSKDMQITVNDDNEIEIICTN